MQIRQWICVSWISPYLLSFCYHLKKQSCNTMSANNNIYTDPRNTTWKLGAVVLSPTNVINGSHVDSATQQTARRDEHAHAQSVAWFALSSNLLRKFLSIDSKEYGVA